MKDLVASASIEIHSTSEQVWDAMTNPAKIRIYLFGTEADTDWKVGSPISFRGEYEGRVYKDKGNVLESIPNKLLKYNYWAQYSGLQDDLKNYFVVAYEIDDLGDGMVRLTWTQSGFQDEKRRDHTANGLPAILAQIKNIAEGETQPAES